jgi:hypothetical protein
MVPLNAVPAGAGAVLVPAPTGDVDAAGGAGEVPGAGVERAASGAGTSTAPAPAGTAFSGTIAEAINTSGYTYARLQSGGEDVWVAATSFDAKIGERVSVTLDLPMQDFDSKTLNRHFALIYFVTEVARNGEPLRGTSPASGPSLASSHGSGTPADAAPTVTRLDPPAGGISIADAFAKRAALSGKPVTVRGTVVKYNGGILDRNWLHLQDGSGTPEAGDNDLTITTDATAKVGDVVTATGVLRLGQDFGAGYAYDVLVEKATLAR